MKRSLILLALVTVLSGCATIKGWFSDSKSENIEPPTPLTEFPATLSVQKLWTGSIGKGAGMTGARSGTAYADGKIFAASVDGEIAAYDANSGRVLWNKKLGSRHGMMWSRSDNSVRWSGGPSVEGDLVVAGTLEGTVQAFAASDGADLWTAQLS